MPLRVLQWITGPWTRTNLWSWVRLIVVVAALKGCIADQYRIPTGSMEPTLHGDPAYFSGDRVLVNKLAYGLRIPFTSIWLAQWDTPDRWEIVTFENPEADSPNRLLIKRVIALPGEEVRIHFGDIYINGEKVTPPANMGEYYYVNQDDLHGRARSMDLPENERRFFQMLDASVDLRYGCRPEPEYSLVPPGHYFLLGDNSIASRDSRVFGWVDGDDIYSRATSVWWPFPRRRDITGWTSTWWGRGLLIAIPATLIGLEAWGMYRRRKAKDAAPAA